MYTDLPLSDIHDDKLGRLFIAKEIADGLVKSFSNNNESIVLGINGTWGSGKSTLVNFIINEVENLSEGLDKEIIVINFNPWMFSGQKELQNIFFKELFIKLESKKGKLKKASKKLADLLGHLNWLKYVHTGVGEAVNDSKKFLESLTKERDLAELKSELDKILIKSEVKLYITIDDIDRLTPAEITDIFQLVKLNGNFANTIFILAYDLKVVTDALKKQFGKNGKKYLEKIIQIDYTLPGVSKTHIARIFEDSLTTIFERELAEKIKSSIHDIKSGLLIDLFTTLRDVYRFNNSIKLRLGSIFNELNIRDFLLIEALRIFRQEVYQFVIENKDRLTQSQKNERVVNLNRIGTGKSETIDQVIEEKNFDELAVSFLHQLFVFDGAFNRYTPEDLIREKRVANRNYFDRYFNLQLEDFDIKEKLFDDFLNQPDLDTKVKVLEQIEEMDRMYHFTTWIEIKSEQTKVNISFIIEAALKFSCSLPYHHGMISMDSSFMVILRFCSKMLDRLSSISERRRIIKQHVSQPKASVSFSSVFVNHSIINSKKLLDSGKLGTNHMWYDLFSEKKDDDDAFANELSDFYGEAVKNLFLRVIKKPEILTDDELYFILFELESNHSDLYEEEFQKFISNERILLRVLLICIVSVYVSTGEIVGFQLSKSQFFRNMDVENIKSRINKIDRADLSHTEIATINFFDKAYKDGFQEKKYYKFETLEEMAGFN